MHICLRYSILKDLQEIPREEKLIWNFLPMTCLKTFMITNNISFMISACILSFCHINQIVIEQKKQPKNIISIMHPYYTVQSDFLCNTLCFMHKCFGPRIFLDLFLEEGKEEKNLGPSAPEDTSQLQSFVTTFYAIEKKIKSLQI